MVDDRQFGTHDKRGNYIPNKPLQIAPFYRLPWKAADILGFLKAYFLPWNVAFMALAAAYWYLVIPEAATLQTLAPGWIALLFACNCATVLAFFGAMELRLYVRRRQGNLFKYNAKWPADNRSDVFMFKSQTIDGMIRTFATGVPIWTAYEVLILWAWANGTGNWTTFADNPVWLVALWLLVPIWHEAHFYLIHRPLHWPFFYKHIHAIHHNSVNPSPWSSLSMHPIEQALFFSSALLYLVVPAHPLFVLYHLQLSGLGSIVGHIGFEKIVLGDRALMDTHTYNHYLHHKYFEVNYGDGTVPFDKLFGTYHDGTPEADAALDRRMRRRRERLAARSG